MGLGLKSFFKSIVMDKVYFLQAYNSTVEENVAVGFK